MSTDRSNETLLLCFLLIDRIISAREIQRFIPVKRQALPEVSTHLFRLLSLHFSGDHRQVHAFFLGDARRGYIHVNSVASLPGPGRKVIRHNDSSGQQYTAYAE